MSGVIEAFKNLAIGIVVLWFVCTVIALFTYLLLVVAWWIPVVIFGIVAAYVMGWIIRDRTA